MQVNAIRMARKSSVGGGEKDPAMPPPSAPSGAGGSCTGASGARESGDDSVCASAGIEAASSTGCSAGSTGAKPSYWRIPAAGAKFVQIDEPAASARMDELPLVAEAMGIVTDGLEAHAITHICYGDFMRAYPTMLDIPVDQIDLEMTNSDYDLLERFREIPFTKSIGLGVVDVHSHRQETVDQVVRGINLALEVLPPERIFVDPDCGLKTRTVEEAEQKMRAIVEGVRRVREERGIGAELPPGGVTEGRTQGAPVAA